MSNQPDVTPVETADAPADDTLLTNTDSDSTDDHTATDEQSDSVDSDSNSGDTDAQAGEGSQDTPPETYTDFDLPEGIELDAAALEKANPVFKDLGLTQEQAQKLVDLQSEMVQAGQQRQMEAFNQLKQEWVNQTKSDKEFGGDKFEESIGTARNAMDKYGTPELSKLMDDYGIGNHPEVVRFMVRVGQTLKEDVPGGNTSASSPEQTRLTQLYGNNAN